MYARDIYIEEYDWKVKAFFHAEKGDEEEVHEALEWAGAPDWVHERLSLELDTGLTYSNKEDGKSVVVVCAGTCHCEEEDTISHEKYHLTRHISSSCHIDPDDEQAAYLSGTIGKLLACGCDSCK